MTFLLGTLGAFVGSYLNVLALRFSPEEGFRASRKGRSRCPHCKQTLRWYELIPVISFFIQGGKCRSCHERLSLQYPIVELLSALVFIAVPWRLGWSPITAPWILVFLVFILLALIDFRLGIIPDKLNFLVAGLGLLIAFLTYYGSVSYSGVGSYALLFQLGEGSFWLQRLMGVVLGLVLFGGIYLFTQGKAMGLGDVKFAGALGILLGWPDVILALVLAFFVGALVAAPLLISGRAVMKSALPFGPFIAIGVTLVFFFGYHILNGYFHLFNFY